jgi:hypothetical protein
MSCYFRHIQDILDEAGIAVTPANRKRVDEAVHRAVGAVYKDCPATWQKLKTEVLNYPDKRRAFVRQIQKELG